MDHDKGLNISTFRPAAAAQWLLLTEGEVADPVVLGLNPDPMVVGLNLGRERGGISTGSE